MPTLRSTTAALRPRASSIDPAFIDHKDEFDAYQDHHESHAKAAAARDKASNKEEAKNNYNMMLLAVIQREAEEREAEAKAAAAAAANPPTARSPQPFEPFRNKSTRSMDPPASLNQFPSAHNPDSSRAGNMWTPSAPRYTSGPSTPLRFESLNATPAMNSRPSTSFHAPARHQHSHASDISSPFGTRRTQLNGATNPTSSSTSSTTPGSHNTASGTTYGTRSRNTRSNAFDFRESTAQTSFGSNPKTLEKIEEETEDESDDDEDEEPEPENVAPSISRADTMSFSEDLLAGVTETLQPSVAPAFYAETPSHFPTASAPFAAPGTAPAPFMPQYEYPSVVTFDDDDSMDTFLDAWEYTDVAMDNAFPDQQAHESDPFAMDTSESPTVEWQWDFLNAHGDQHHDQHGEQSGEYRWEHHPEQHGEAEPNPPSAAWESFLPSNEDTPAKNETTEDAHKFTTFVDTKPIYVESWDLPRSVNPMPEPSPSPPPTAQENYAPYTPAPPYYAVQRKSQIPAPKEAAEPALDALLDEKRAEKAMYASRFGKEPKTFEDAVAIFAGPLKRSPATYYASSAASRDAGVSNNKRKFDEAEARILYRALQIESGADEIIYAPLPKRRKTAHMVEPAVSRTEERETRYNLPGILKQAEILRNKRRREQTRRDSQRTSNILRTSLRTVARFFGW